MKSHKTPLRYPGGKSRACEKMARYLPDLRDYKEFREPFLGGGSFAIYITKKYPHLNVWVNDLYEPLVNFWQQLQMFGVEIKNQLIDYKSTHNNPESARELFLNAKDWVNDKTKSNFDRAVAFYIVNKCSFSGLTESSSFSAKASVSNFSLRGIMKLDGYQDIIKNWKISNYSFDFMMDAPKGTFYYLDPPYDIKDNLYGKKGSMHKGFDHDFFAKTANACNSDCLISYNADQLVRDRFKDDKWNAAEFDLTYTMRSVGEYMRDQKQRKELLLFNYGIEGLVEQYQSDKEASD